MVRFNNGIIYLDRCTDDHGNTVATPRGTMALAHYFFGECGPLLDIPTMHRHRVQTLVNTLRRYGARMEGCGQVVRHGKPLAFRTIPHGWRVRFESLDGKQIANGPASDDFISKVLETLFYWKVGT